MAGQLDRIPLDSIRASHGRWPMRRHIDPVVVERLAEELARNGLRHPIVVTRGTDARRAFDLVLGRLRLAAAHALGWDDIETRVLQLAPADAATLVLAEEFQTSTDMTYLERGWAVVETMQLRRDSGLPSGVRATAQACGMSKSTLQNARRIGSALPRRLVLKACHELELSLRDIMTIEQAPLLVIAKHQERRPALLRTALAAHAEGRNPLHALRDVLEDAPDPINRLEERGDGRLNLRMDTPMAELSREAATDLATELREGADRLEALAGVRPTGVQTVQRLDAAARLRLRGLVLRAIRLLKALLAPLLSGVRRRP